jgi:trehalose/maltose hydrolase-like predicted phosphorylase
MTRKKNYAYGGKATAILEWLNTEPTASDNEIAKYVQCSVSYVKKLRSQMAHVPESPKHFVVGKDIDIDPETLEEVTLVTSMGRKEREEYAKSKAKLKETIASWRKEAEATDVDAILDARADQYGSFMQSADVAIKIKGVMHNAIARNDLHMFPDQLLALDMIAVKISRILTGNPSHVDSWVDIAGYAKLVSDRLEGKVR